MRSYIDNILSTPHVVCCVVEMCHVVRVDGVVPDVDRSAIFIGEDESFGLALRVPETPHKMVLKPFTKELCVN